jgi:hypothetical protein
MVKSLIPRVWTGNGESYYRAPSRDLKSPCFLKMTHDNFSAMANSTVVTSLGTLQRFYRQSTQEGGGGGCAGYPSACFR